MSEYIGSQIELENLVYRLTYPSSGPEKDRKVFRTRSLSKLKFYY